MQLRHPPASCWNLLPRNIVKTRCFISQPLIYLNIRPSLRLCGPFAGVFVCPGEGRHLPHVCATHELIFVRRGTLAMAEAGDAFEAGAGQAVLLRKDTEHTGTAPYPANLIFYWAHFQCDAASNEGCLALPRVTTVRDPLWMTMLFNRLLNQHAPSAASDQTLRSRNAMPADNGHTGDLSHWEQASAGLLLSEMLCEVARSATAAAPAPSGNHNASAAELPLAKLAAEFIAANAHKSISASAIAAALRCNSAYLSRLFRQAYGRTMTDEIHRRRVEAIAHMLISEPYSINEIARKCGFKDESYMATIFRRVTGMTPLAYRRQFSLGRGVYTV